MTTEDEALKATREALEAAGVELDADGRVKPISARLAELAQDGGAVLDAETLTDWSVRGQVGEQALLTLARRAVATTTLAKEWPEMRGAAYEAFHRIVVDVLSRAVPQFIYGQSPEVIREAGAALLDFRAKRAEERAG